MRPALCSVAVMAMWFSAADWPQHRGPTQDGVAAAEDLADAWPDAGPPVLWSREIGGGYSAFAVVNGRAYTQAQSLYDQHVLCLDAETGKTIWQTSYGLPFDGGTYPGPRATPTVVAGRVCFAAPNGLVGCLDALTGGLQWKVQLKEKFQGKGTDFGVSASPLVVDGLVIVPVGGPTASLLALSLATGEIVWKCGEKPASYATPLSLTVDGRRWIVAPLENSLLCADAATGEKGWELALSHGYDEHSAALVYREPRLFMAAPFRSGGQQSELSVDDAGMRIERRWESLKMSNDIASCVLAGDVLYGFDLKEPQARLNRPSRGEFRALDWQTGAVLWSSPEPGHANIIAADGKLLLFNDRGELLLVRQSGERYDEAARATVFRDEICWTPPALANGRVYLRTQTRAACLYVGRGPPPAERTTTLDRIPQPRRIDPQALLGGEREFPATPPDNVELGWWFGWNLGGLALAGGCSLVTGRLGKCSAATTTALFFVFAAGVGVGGGAIINRLQPDFVFLLPLALWSLLQATCEVSIWATRNNSRRSAGWMARGMTLGFVAGCALYFHFCRRLGLSIEWSFLVGFLPAFPLACGSSALAFRRERAWFWPSAALRVASFASYFWACALFMHYRLAAGG